MPIKMMRIDDRLIHGQVVTAWVKYIQAERIWIVDDVVSKDEFLKSVMKMVAPSDTELVVSDTASITELVKKYEASSKNTLILVKTPYVAKMILDNGMELRELNLGGMGASTDRKKLFKNISASEEEVAVLKEIKNDGVYVYFQITPNEKQTKL